MPVDPLNAAILAVSDRTSADSLFLRCVPTRKFPPFQYPPFPRDVLIRISSEVAMKAIFPFHFVDNNDSVFKTKEDLHKYIMMMAMDREMVIKQPVRIEVSTSPPITSDLR